MSKTKLNLSIVDHPQTDGKIKRVNLVLEDILRAYISKKQINWERLFAHIGVCI